MKHYSVDIRNESRFKIGDRNLRTALDVMVTTLKSSDSDRALH
jgi:hypothetical protein